MRDFVISLFFLAFIVEETGRYLLNQAELGWGNAATDN